MHNLLQNTGNRLSQASGSGAVEKLTTEGNFMSYSNNRNQIKNQYNGPLSTVWPFMYFLILLPN